MVLSRKELQKQKKAIYTKINIEVAPYEQPLEQISPFFPILSGEVNAIQFFKRLTQDAIGMGFRPEGMDYAARKGHKCYTDNIIQLLKTEKAIDNGLNDDDVIKKRNDALRNVSNTLTLFQTEYRLDFCKQLQDMKLLTNVSMTRIKHYLYYENDELKRSDAGLEFSKLCFENAEYATILDMLEDEIEDLKDETDPDIKSHFIREDAEKIRELLKGDDLFYVYRGFLVDEDEYVRAGKKVDGADYYKQNAGKGVSYSINEETAMYFIYWNLTFKEDGTDNEFGNDIRTAIDILPKTLATKEDYISSQSKKISIRRDGLKKKPIMCKFLIDPTMVRGQHTTKNEAELNLLPDDLAVEHYEIPHSDEIASKMYDFLLKAKRQVMDYDALYKEDGVVISVYKENGRYYCIYADANSVNDKVNEVRKKMLDGKPVDWMNELKDAFLDAAIELPKDIDPVKATPRWLDFINRAPEKMLRKRGTKYLINNL